MTFGFGHRALAWREPSESCQATPDIEFFRACNDTPNPPPRQPCDELSAYRQWVVISDWLPSGTTISSKASGTLRGRAPRDRQPCLHIATGRHDEVNRGRRPPRGRCVLQTAKDASRSNCQQSWRMRQKTSRLMAALCATVLFWRYGDFRAPNGATLRCFTHPPGRSLLSSFPLC